MADNLATMMNGGLSGGTGQKLTRATIIVAGVASLVATVLSIVYGCQVTIFPGFFRANTSYLQINMASDVRTSSDAARRLLT